MKPESVKFIYRAVNEIASGKHDALTEQCLADAIEQELIAVRAHLTIQREAQAGANHSNAPEQGERELSLISLSAAAR